MLYAALPGVGHLGGHVDHLGHDASTGVVGFLWVASDVGIHRVLY